MRFVYPIVALPLLLVPSATTHTPAPREDSAMPLERTELHPGERLVRVLDNRTAAKRVRVAAARELGRLKYAPAIPMLLKHVALDSGSLVYMDESLFTVLASWPCVEALAQFGSEVVEPAARMYVSPTTNERGRECLEYMLKQESTARSRETTLEQVRDYGRRIQNQFERDRLLELYYRLHKVGEQRVPPGDWPKFAPPTGGPGQPLNHVRRRVETIG